MKFVWKFTVKVHFMDLVRNCNSRRPFLNALDANIDLQGEKQLKPYHCHRWTQVTNFCRLFPSITRSTVNKKLAHRQRLKFSTLNIDESDEEEWKSFLYYPRKVVYLPHRPARRRYDIYLQLCNHLMLSCLALCFLKMAGEFAFWNEWK